MSKNFPLIFSISLYWMAYIPFFAQHSPIITLFVFLNSLIGFIFYHFNYRAAGILRFSYSVFLFVIPTLTTGKVLGLQTGVSILAILPGLKLLEMKEKRDYFIFALIVELLLASHVLSQDELYFVPYIYFVTGALFFFLLKLGNHSINAKIGMKILYRVMLFSIPLTIVFFFTFPRVPSPLAFWKKGIQGMTGISKELRPGDFASLVEDEKVIFRASMGNRKFSLSQLYWRNRVLQNNDVFNWKMGKVPREKVTNKSSQRGEFSITYNESEDHLLSVLENTFAIEPQSKMRVMREGGGLFRALAFSNVPYRYIGQFVSSEPNIKIKDRLDLYLQTSEKIPLSVQKIADKLKRATLDQFLDSFSSFLVENKYKYTLRPRKPLLGSSESAIEFFMFKSKEGYCEHYASITALIGRLAGFHSRVVVGYQGGEYNEFGDYYVIRAKDSHAWVEFWDEKNASWRRFDPTFYVAPERIQLGQEDFVNNVIQGAGAFSSRSSFWGKFRRVVDMSYYGLNQAFLGYDVDVQKEFYKKFGLQNIKITWSYVVLVGFLLFALFLLKILLSTLKRNSVEHDYIRLLDKIEKVAPKKSKSEGPQKYCARVISHLGKNDEVTRLFDLYIQITYAQNGDPELKRTFSKGVRHFDPKKLHLAQ